MKISDEDIKAYLEVLDKWPGYQNAKDGIRHVLSTYGEMREENERLQSQIMAAQNRSGYDDGFDNGYKAAIAQSEGEK